MRTELAADHLPVKWLALYLAILATGCDRFNDARIFTNFSDPSVELQLQEVFTANFSQGDTTCWNVAEDAEAFIDFDQTAWSFIACRNHESGILASFGSTKDAAFASLRMTSSGLRSQPEEFGELRSAILDSFRKVAGADRVEVVDSPEPAYFEPLHEAVERWRHAQEPDPSPHGPS